MDKLAFYFQYPLVRYALIVSVLIALCSSLLGVTLVLKRFSLIGDGLSRVAFGAAAVAAAFSLNDDFLMVIPLTVICAVLLLRAGQNAKIKGDAAIAMISSGALAGGYLIMKLFPKTSNVSRDVCATLFGSEKILMLTKTETWMCAILSAVVIAIFAIFYHKIFAVTFDEDFSAATGLRAKVYNSMLAVVSGVVVVLAMNMVGALLISALLIFPALSAMRVFKNFKAVTVCSMLISVICATLGILISIVAGTPVGSTIVVVYAAGFFVFGGAGIITRRG
jgi:zinc transport system permease protein